MVEFSYRPNPPGSPTPLLILLHLCSTQTNTDPLMGRRPRRSASGALPHKSHRVMETERSRSEEGGAAKEEELRWTHYEAAATFSPAVKSPSCFDPDLESMPKLQIIAGEGLKAAAMSPETKS
ncbi:hypothetical protein AOLI_G00121110 [Acnodon oligacanthus]